MGVSLLPLHHPIDQHLATLGYQRVLLLMALPGLKTDLALRSMRLLAEHVVPALR